MAFNAKPGDVARLRLAHEEIDGVVLDSHDPGVVLLKLDSGYNIGIMKENILAGRVLKKAERTEKDKKNTDVFATKKEGLPCLGLIMTGGTIAAKLDPKEAGQVG
jgi:glutamyl-tRNA(Gln) amidotransferase subunit D